MNLDELKSQLPDYAKDLRLNLESVLSEGGAPGLTRKQIAVIALASASCLALQATYGSDQRGFGPARRS